MRPRVQRASGIPCSLVLGRNGSNHSGASRRGNNFRRPGEGRDPYAAAYRRERRRQRAFSNYERRGVWVPAQGRDDGGVCCRTIIQTHLRILAAHCARGLQEIFSPSQFRGRRECRMRAAPAVSCAIVHKNAAHEHTGQRRTSDIPCAMALRLMTRSPR